MTRAILGFFLTTALLIGCQPSEPVGALPPERVPTTGKVTLDGKPLAGAVVVFNPVDETGTLTQSDTGEDGSYDLKLANFPGGTAPGKYKVYISYLVAPNGQPQGLGPRSSLQVSDDFLNAKELLPGKYSNPGESELTATVPAEGGVFNFDLVGPLLPAPEPAASTEAKPAAEAPAAAPAEEPAKAAGSDEAKPEPKAEP